MSFLDFPFPRFSYYNRRPYQRYEYKYNDVDSTIKKEPPRKEEDSSSRDSSDNSDVQDFFEILGIKLYLDDVLIICLLFFLYNEEVQDQGLFICLILLLLS